MTRSRTLVHQTVVPEGFAVIAGEDDDGVVSLPGFVQGLEDTPELIVNLGDHGVIAGLSPFGVVFLGDVRTSSWKSQSASLA